MRKTLYFKIGLLLPLIASTALASAPPELIPLGSTWRYLDDGSNQGVAWSLNGFDDSGWSSGAAELGYGDGGEITTVSYGGDSAAKHITTYFRHSFEVADPAAYGPLQIEVQRDDGVIVYLNGTEILRDNLPSDSINSSTLAISAIGGADETLLLTAGVDPALLVAGSNTVAVEIHQANSTSSDISFNLRLVEAPPPLTELVPAGSTWRYLDDGSNQGTSWATASFDDSGWSSGPAELGYGDGGEATLVSFGGDAANKHPTTYFRHSFDVTDPAALQALQLEVQRDDGVAIYLNGSEIFRDNLPAGSINSSTFAISAVSSSGETDWLRAGVDPALLVAGSNILAAEIHQVNATSSDISFDLRLVEAAPPSLVRGPYLQRSSASQITIRWRTSSATDSVVNYGTDPANLEFVASSPAVTTEHSVTIAGLASDTRYVYNIGNSQTQFAGGEGFYFDTHPPTGTPTATRVWVLGDSGTANANAAAVRDAYTAYNGGSPQADVWLMLGDNAYNDGTDLEYQAAVFDMYPATLRNSVLWSTLGNHDGHSADSATQAGPYYEIHTLPTSGESGGVASGTEAYYSFDYGNIHFVCLDSYETNRATGAAMATWLENDLAATNQEWIIAFWHHPPYSKGSHDSDTEAALVEMRQNFLPILDNYGVDLVLGGHSHSYERSMLIDGHYGHSSTFTNEMIVNGGDGQPAGDGAYEKAAATSHAGTVYVVAGSSGKITSAPLNHPVMISNLVELGSMVIDVDGDRLEAVFLNDHGNVRDSFTLLHQSVAAEIPEAPSELMAMALDASQIALTWSDNSLIEDTYIVERSVDLSSWTTVAATLPANSTSYVDTGLTAGTSYTYRVFSSNLSGTSASSNLASATTDAAPPFLGSIASSETVGSSAIIGDFTATHADDDIVQSLAEIESGGKPANRHSHLLHTWHFDLPVGTASTLLANVYSSGSTDGDRFRFEYSVDGGTSWTLAFEVSATAKDHQETALLQGATGGPLLLRVTDTDRTSGNHELNTIHIDELHIRTETEPGEPPAAPTALSAVAASAAEIQLAWTDQAHDELGFEIERLNAGAPDWFYLTTVAADSSSFSDTSVSPNSSYSYRLRAFNASGASPNSNIASATTPPAPAPTGIVLEANGSKVKGVLTTSLSWTGATSAKVDIFRDGTLLTTVPNTGSYTDSTGIKGGGTLTYQVSEEGDASTLSNESTVSF